MDVKEIKIGNLYQFTPNINHYEYDWDKMMALKGMTIQVMAFSPNFPNTIQVRLLHDGHTFWTTNDQIELVEEEYREMSQQDLVEDIVVSNMKEIKDVLSSLSKWIDEEYNINNFEEQLEMTWKVKELLEKVTDLMNE